MALQCKTFFFLVRYSGVLSAYGLALADVVEEVQEPCCLKYEADSYSELDHRNRATLSTLRSNTAQRRL